MERTQPAGRREWLGLAVLLLPTLLVALDMTALFLALPRLSADLSASRIQQLWISDSYGFLVAGLVITMGTLGDRIGRRRLLLVGAAGFMVMSLVGAYATSPEVLIAARALQGVAGATLMPSTLALISNMFTDERQRGRAIATWATCQFAGGALGPVVAGVLLQHFWWGSVFLMAVPMLGLLLILGPVVLPEFRNPNAGRIDPRSVALSLAAVLPVVYGLKQLTVDGAQNLTVPLGAIAIGAGFGVVFVRRQLRLATPLLDLRLLRNPAFTSVLIGLMLAGIAMAGCGLLVTQYLQTVLGFGPLDSALLFAPMGIGVAIGTMTAPMLAQRMATRTAITGGLSVSVLGCLALAAAHGAPALPLVIVGITVLALGTGPLFALGTGLVVGSVPPERAGSAASMSETSNYLGGSLGIAVLGAIGAAVYRLNLPSGAVAPAVARTAFAAGLTVVGLVSAAIFAVIALLVARRQRPTSQDRAPQPAAVPSAALE
ncbi:MAG TPA: MFS transporter [Pseudonocardiaceae bacterium]|nr:MFS transporter [Pseudonocardiaceae bacterium]